MNDAHIVEREPRRSLRRRLIRSSIALVAFVILFAATSRFEALYDLEASARDFDARARAPVATDSIVLVRITDHDYDALFAGRSPLNPDTLGRLVRVAAAAGSRVVGVDIETSDRGFQRLWGLADSLSRAGARVVWAQDALSCDSANKVEAAGARQPACREHALRPLGVLGVSDSAARAAGVTTGLVVIQLDPKGTVRHYRQLLPTTNGIRSSFVGALGSAYGATSAQSHPDTSAHFVSFHRGRSGGWELSATQLLSLGASPDHGRSVLAGKALVIGGSYRAARDAYHTPLGMRSGVEIHAQALQTVLQGGGPGVPSHRLLEALQLLAGVLLMVLPFSASPGRALLALLLAIFVMSIACSWILTGSRFAGIWYFLPLFVLLVIHHLYERANLYRERFLHELYHQARGGAVKEEPIEPLIERVDVVFSNLATNARSGVQNATRRWQLMRRRIGGSAVARDADSREALEPGQTASPDDQDQVEPRDPREPVLPVRPGN